MSNHIRFPEYNESAHRVEDTTRYKRMKEVKRSKNKNGGYTGWMVYVVWGPEILQGYFADRFWGGAVNALVAANAFAADCYLALQKPITRRRSHYPFYGRSNTGEMNIRQNKSGSFSVIVSNVNGEKVRHCFPEETSMDELLAARDELLQLAYDAQPIDFYR